FVLRQQTGCLGCGCAGHCPRQLSAHRLVEEYTSPPPDGPGGMAGIDQRRGRWPTNRLRMDSTELLNRFCPRRSARLRELATHASSRSRFRQGSHKVNSYLWLNCWGQRGGMERRQTMDSSRLLRQQLLALSRCDLRLVHML